MAIRLEDIYAYFIGASTDYPGGSFKNASTGGGSDGTPLDLQWANDFLGARDAILSAAGQGYSGAPDTAQSSDMLDALYTLFVKNADAVSAATPNRVARRDANGRMKVVAPAVSTDVALKSTVEDHATLTAPHSATASAVANRLALRDSDGRLEGATALSGNDLVNIAQFAKSLGVTGKQSLPGGLLLQWKTVAAVVGTGGTINWLNPFDTAVYAAFAQTDQQAIGGNILRRHAPTINGVDYSWDSFSGVGVGDPCNITVIAIGV